MRVLAKSIRVFDKERFKGYLSLLHQISRKNDELTEIKTKLENLSSPKISDMPKIQSNNNDKIAFLTQEKIATEKDLYKLSQRREIERRELIRAICSLENLTTTLREKKVLIKEASVLRLRYFGMFSWEEINANLHKDESDFESKKEDYLQKTFKYHGQAFIDLKNIN